MREGKVMDENKYQEAIRATIPSENGLTASEYDEQRYADFVRSCQEENTNDIYDKFIKDRAEQEREQEELREMLLPKEETDNVNSPSHYTQGKVECIDAIEASTINKEGIEAVCVANIIKYLWRYEDKNGLEDVKKARWYLNKLIERMEDE